MIRVFTATFRLIPLSIAPSGLVVDVACAGHSYDLDLLAMLVLHDVCEHVTLYDT